MDLIQEKIKNKKVVVFGTGSGLVSLLTELERPVNYLIDNDDKKWGQELFGLPVYSPNYLLNEIKDDIVVFIASITYSREISQQLIKLGFVQNVHFFIDESMMKYKPRKTTYHRNIMNKGFSILKSADTGQILLNQDQKKVYRGYFKNEVKKMHEIYLICCKAGFFNTYHVNTTIAEGTGIEGYEILFEHEYIETITEVKHWSPKMIYDAAITALEFIYELADYGLSLRDTIPVNMTYHCNTFKIIDFGSIKFQRDISIEWPILKFIKNRELNEINFIQILLYIKAGVGTKGYYSPFSTVFGWLGEEDREEYKRIFDHLKSMLNSNLSLREKTQRCVRVLQSYVENLEPTVDFELMSYYKKIFNDKKGVPYSVSNTLDKLALFINNKLFDDCLLIDLSFDLNKRSIYLLNKLNEIKELKILQNNPVINDIIYCLTRENKINAIPIVTNRYDQSNIHEEKYNMSNLLQSDLCVAFGFLSRVIVYNQYTLEEAVLEIKSLTKHYAVVEVDKLEKIWNDDFQREYRWYSFENACRAFEMHFIIESIEKVNENSIFLFMKLKH